MLPWYVVTIIIAIHRSVHHKVVFYQNGYLLLQKQRHMVAEGR